MEDSKIISITTDSWKWDENGMKALLEDNDDHFKVTDIHMLPDGLSISATCIKAPVMDNFYVPRIKKVIFNYPATIIIWNDNSKTVVKLMEDDEWDPEKGFVMAYLKKILGTNRLRKEIKTWVKPQEKLEAETAFVALDNLKNQASSLGDALSRYLTQLFKPENKLTPEDKE